MTDATSHAQAARSRTLLQVAILAVSYFLAGRLALGLAVQSGFAVAVWPAAGIAAAALLLYGSRVWPGVFLGALLVVVTTTFDATSTPAVLTSLQVPLLIGVGATLQALLAAFLVRRVAGFPFRLNAPGKLLLGILLAGPVACLLGCACAAATLHLTGRLPPDALGSTLFTWWLGDVIGTLLVVPIASEWRREMRFAIPKVRWLVGVPIGMGLLVTAVGFLNVRASEDARAKEEFARHAAVLAGAINETVQGNVELVHSLASVVENSERLSRARFRAFVEKARERHGELKALGLNRVTRHEEIPALEAEARAAGHVDFEVREMGDANTLVPARPREGPHVVVIHIEPLEGNENALGYDIASNVDRRRALQAVVASRRPASTPPIRLVQDTEEQQGFLLFVPVYAAGESNAPEPWPQFFATGVFRAGDLVARAVRRLPERGIGFEILDVKQSQDPIPVAGRGSRADVGGPGTEWQITIPLADRRWRMTFWPTASYDAGLLWGRSWFALTLGLLCTSLLGVFLLTLAGRTAATSRRNDELRLRIEEREQAQTALRESERMLAEAQRIGGLGSWEYDIAGDRMLWSAESQRLLALDGCAVTHGFDSLIERVHSEDRKTAREHLDTALREHGPCESQFRVVRADGEIVHVRSVGEVHRDEEDRPRRVVGTLQDISERVRVEEQRLRFESKLQQAQKLESLGSLAGGIAHDFNNILTSVLGHTDLALEDLPSGTALHDRLKSIETATHRAAELCQQMLAYSGHGQFVLEPLDLRDLVREMTQMLRISVAKNVDLRYVLSEEPPVVHADLPQMRQVLLNLITNASESMEEHPGVITVATGVTPCAPEELRDCHGEVPQEPGDFAYLEVTDTGCGMTADVQARLFEPFFTTKFTGRGLGMAALLGIVRGHRGCLRVESEAGRGTRIRVLLPAAPRDAAPSRARGQPAASEGESTTVLLVDDEPGVREIAEAMLRSLGCDVVVAEDGESALARFRELGKRIDVVLLDLTMPGMDGKETFRELRRVDPRARVILTSGYSGPSVMADTRGFAGFIQKPFLLRGLREALEQASVLPG